MNRVKGNIFLVDSIGALVSALFLGAVLPRIAIGVSTETLYTLCIFAVIMGMYSGLCFCFRRSSTKLLIVSVVMNLLYCLYSAFVLIGNLETITNLGIIYFVGEKIIVLALVYVEWGIITANRNLN
jgi:hypothetical protein